MELYLQGPLGKLYLPSPLRRFLYRRLGHRGLTGRTTAKIWDHGSEDRVRFPRELWKYLAKGAKGFLARKPSRRPDWTNENIHDAVLLKRGHRDIGLAQQLQG